MKDIRWKLAALAAAVIVAACGGGETADGPSNKVGITPMVSFGDSLSDIGTYNVGSIAGLGACHRRRRALHRERHHGRPDLDRAHRGRCSLCQRFCSAETGLSPNPPAGLTGAPPRPSRSCTNYAAGRLRVTNPMGSSSMPAAVRPPSTRQPAA